MRLTVLGNASRYLAPLSGGSSYLLEHDGTRILLDAGHGAREALAAAGVDELHAVWLSHMHFDHLLDLPTLGGAMDDDARILLPRGERRRLDALADAYVWGAAFEMAAGADEVEEGSELRIGPFRLTFARTQHSAPAIAARFEVGGSGGPSVVYASDTAPCAALERLARGADLLLMHTLLPTVELGSEHARIHATAGSAGAMARDAGAKRLLLSHRYHESPDSAMREAAMRAFERVDLAVEGRGYDVGDL